MRSNDLTIATVREDGYPQATTISYVNDGLTIYFGCAAQSQKAKNIARSAKVSLTVNLPYASWDEIRGLSVGGKAARVTDPKEMDRVGRLMLRKFPQIARYAPDGHGRNWCCSGLPRKSFPFSTTARGLATRISSRPPLEGIGARGALPSILMAEQKTQSPDPGVELRTPPYEQHGGLPAVIEQAPPRADRRRRSRVVLLALVVDHRRRRGHRLVMVAALSGAAAAWHRLRKRPPRSRRDRHRHKVCRPHREAVRR